MGLGNRAALSSSVPVVRPVRDVTPSLRSPAEVWDENRNMRHQLNRIHSEYRNREFEAVAVERTWEMRNEHLNNRLNDVQERLDASLRREHDLSILCSDLEKMTNILSTKIERREAELENVKTSDKIDLEAALQEQNEALEGLRSVNNIVPVQYLTQKSVTDEPGNETMKHYNLLSRTGKANQIDSIYRTVEYMFKGRGLTGDDAVDDEKKSLTEGWLKLGRKVGVMFTGERRKMTVEEQALFNLTFPKANMAERMKAMLRQFDIDLDIFAPNKKSREFLKSMKSGYSTREMTERVKKQKKGRRPPEEAELEKLEKKNKREMSLRKKTEEDKGEDDNVDVVYDDIREVQVVVLEQDEVREEFEKRVRTGVSRGRLDLKGCFADSNGVGSVWAGLTLDCGDNITKGGILIGNLLLPNSRVNMQLTFMYDGQDSRFNLDGKVSSTLQAMSNLPPVDTVDPDGNPLTVPVESFLVADGKATCTVLGHDGAMATFNCPYCKRQRGTTYGQRLMEGTTIDGEKAYMYCSEDAEKRTLNDNSYHLPKPLQYSMSKSPLLHVHVDNVVPEVMNIMSGVVVPFVLALKEIFVRKDFEASQIPWPGTLDNAKKMLKQVQKDITSLICSEKSETIEEKRRSITANKFKLCQYAKAMSIAIRLDGMNGKVLDKRLRRYNLQGNFYGAMTGNQIKKMLEKDVIDELWEGVSKEEMGTYKEMMCTLSVIFSYGAARFYSMQEINVLDSYIRKLAILMGVSQEWKNRQVTQKFHILFEHVIPFMTKWKTWGMLSSQGIEAAHPAITNLLFDYASLKPKTKRFNSVATQFNAKVKLRDGSSLAPQAKKHRQHAFQFATNYTQKK